MISIFYINYNNDPLPCIININYWIIPRFVLYGIMKHHMINYKFTMRERGKKEKERKKKTWAVPVLRSCQSIGLDQHGLSNCFSVPIVARQGILGDPIHHVNQTPK